MPSYRDSALIGLVECCVCVIPVILACCACDTQEPALEESIMACGS